MANDFSEKRILFRVNDMLNSGRSDKDIIDEIKKRNSGADPATIALIIQIVLAAIKAWRERKKASLKAKRKFKREGSR